MLMLTSSMIPLCTQIENPFTLAANTHDMTEFLIGAMRSQDMAV